MSIEDKLQIFIEDNTSKKFGDKYIYENLIIPTRVYESYKVIEVYLVLPWTTFSIRVKYDKISNHVLFFGWLKDIFIPMAEDKLKPPETK